MMVESLQDNPCLYFFSRCLMQSVVFGACKKELKFSLICDTGFSCTGKFMTYHKHVTITAIIGRAWEPHILTEGTENQIKTHLCF